LVAIKATGYGIKKMAPLAHFDWQVDDPGGALSLLKYREAIDEKLTEEERKHIVNGCAATTSMM
jgi:hypothetical protein